MMTPSNRPQNRRVLVTYKPETKFNQKTGEPQITQRPPFETTEANLATHKRIHGAIIKEIKVIDENGGQISLVTENKPSAQVVEKIVEKVVVKEVSKEPTDEELICALYKKGKNYNSIARTLDIPIGEVEAIVNKNLGLSKSQN